MPPKTVPSPPPRNLKLPLIAEQGGHDLPINIDPLGNAFVRACNPNTGQAASFLVSTESLEAVKGTFSQIALGSWTEPTEACPIRTYHVSAPRPELMQVLLRHMHFPEDESLDVYQDLDLATVFDVLTLAASLDYAGQMHDWAHARFSSARFGQHYAKHFALSILFRSASPFWHCARYICRNSVIDDAGQLCCQDEVLSSAIHGVGGAAETVGEIAAQRYNMVAALLGPLKNLFLELTCRKYCDEVCDRLQPSGDFPQSPPFLQKPMTCFSGIDCEVYLEFFEHGINLFKDDPAKEYRGSVEALLHIVEKLRRAVQDRPDQAMPYTCQKECKRRLTDTRVFATHQLSRIFLTFPQEVETLLGLSEHERTRGMSESTPDATFRLPCLEAWETVNRANRRSMRAGQMAQHQVQQQVGHQAQQQAGQQGSRSPYLTW
ncbi:hypothetical protein C8035_v000651 [Colletotrichum spinosum]|uniref:BTB domain-containing protein n=1 Tax=Colletotrichum spinosum TaxID=1347390 RepID=A0A4R8QDA5_9PEZI|nr:hypothetical protein C8035_v000651 [Colletotrichum spinosum]